MDFPCDTNGTRCDAESIAIDPGPRTRPHGAWLLLSTVGASTVERESFDPHLVLHTDCATSPCNQMRSLFDAPHESPQIVLLHFRHDSCPVATPKTAGSLHCDNPSDSHCSWSPSY